MNEIVKICKIHGELEKEQIVFNRLSPKGKPYYKCRICRNLAEYNRTTKIKYSVYPRKHKKNKLPDFINEKESKSHAYTILYKFKMSANEYYELLKKQNYVCAICKKPESVANKKGRKINSLAIDHCHKTNKIRGLLCHQCNIGLGAYKDSIENLYAAIEYLKSTSP